mmetsp:Transcript_7368/g.10882  ORF Transcript_7368/g.10882 Transcript_7368/m.10882 type:complete len:266 (+) Transcript_7368:132-929(+)
MGFEIDLDPDEGVGRTLVGKCEVFALQQCAELDSIREVVSGLLNKFWLNKCLVELLDDSLASVDVLPPGSENTDHCKAAVFDFLQLLLAVLLFRIVEVERIESALPKPNISWLVVTCDALEVALAFEGANEESDLEKSPLRNGVDCGKRVKLAKVVCLVSRKSAEEAWPHEADECELRNTSVLKLSLPVPLEAFEWQVIGVDRKPKRIEAHITHKRTVKRRRCVGERKSLRLAHGRRLSDRSSARASAHTHRRSSVSSSAAEQKG